LKQLIFSAITGILFISILGNSGLAFGEDASDDYDNVLSGALEELLSIELIQGAYGGTGAPTTMGFEDEYDFEHWIFGTDGDGVVIDNSPNSIELIGSDESGFCESNSVSTTTADGRGVNAAVFGEFGCLTFFEIEVPCNGNIGFDWAWSTLDGPSFDPMGFHLNDIVTQLTDDAGADIQSDSEMVPVNAGDIFGWVIDSTDDVEGESRVTIDAFSGPWCPKVGGEFIPVDTTALLLAGSQANALWLIPVIVAAAAFAIVIARKF